MPSLHCVRGGTISLFTYLKTIFVTLPLRTPVHKRHKPTSQNAGANSLTWHGLPSGFPSSRVHDPTNTSNPAMSVTIAVYCQLALILRKTAGIFFLFSAVRLNFFTLTKCAESGYFHWEPGSVQKVRAREEHARVDQTHHCQNR